MLTVKLNFHLEYNEKSTAISAELVMSYLWQMSLSVFECVNFAYKNTKQIGFYDAEQCTSCKETTKIIKKQTLIQYQLRQIASNEY